MSQQGERPTGHQDDWWGQLYDDSTGDTGPAPASDSVDDRYTSATNTLNPNRPTNPADVPGPRQGRGELRAQPPRGPAADDRTPPEGPAPGRPANPADVPGPRQGRGELRAQPPRGP
ncbi:hypothetical protein ACFYXC_04955, partial [Streptomyces sp. NPDC002701]